MPTWSDCQYDWHTYTAIVLEQPVLMQNWGIRMHPTLQISTFHACFYSYTFRDIDLLLFKNLTVTIIFHISNG